MSHKFQYVLYMAATAKWHGILPSSVERSVNELMAETTVVAERRELYRELSNACALQMVALSKGKTPVWELDGTRVFSGYACGLDYEQLPEPVRELWFENATRAGNNLAAVSKGDFTIVLKTEGSVIISCGSAVAIGRTSRDVVDWAIIVLIYIIVGVSIFLGSLK